MHVRVRQRDGLIVRVAVDVCLDERALRVHAVAVLHGVVQHVFDQGCAYAASAQGWGDPGVREYQLIVLQGVAGVGCLPVDHCFKTLLVGDVGDEKVCLGHG